MQCSRTAAELAAPRLTRYSELGAEPDPGIPLTADFKREYERIAQGLERKGTQTNILRRSYTVFNPGIWTNTCPPRKLSPEVLALRRPRQPIGNPLR